MATTPEKTEALPKDTFTPGQVAAIATIADPDWQGAILFAWGTGGRLADVANLKWSNLDVAAGIVVFHERKTKARAVLGLHPDFLDWLVSRPAPEEPDAPVFPSLAGRKLKRRRRSFKPICPAHGKGRDPRAPLAPGKR
jgi:integrase